QEVYSDTLCIVAPKKHPLVREKAISFDALLQDEWVLPPAGSFFHDHIQRALVKAGYAMPSPSIETLSSSVMHGLISAGPYVGFSTLSVYRHNPVKPFVSRLDVPLPNVLAPIGAVSLKDRPVD